MSDNLLQVLPGEKLEEALEFMRQSEGMKDSPQIAQIEDECKRRKSEGLIEKYGAGRMAYDDDEGYYFSHILIDGVWVPIGGDVQQMAHVNGQPGKVGVLVKAVQTDGTNLI